MLPDIIIFIVIFVIGVFFVFFLLPKKLFSVIYKDNLSFGEGIKKVETENGITVVFKMTDNDKYIKQYLISNEKEKNFLMCLIDKNIYFINYNIAIYNQKKKMIKVLNVNDYVTRLGYTSRIDLPLYTEYISLVVNKVNEEAIKQNYKFKIRLWKIPLFSLLESISLVGILYSLIMILIDLFGGVFQESLKEQVLISYIFMGLAVFFFINTLVLLIVMKVKSIKGGK